MSHPPPERLLFVINPRSGNNDTDWQKLILDHYTNKPVSLEFILLDKQCCSETIRESIKKFKADKIIAVGGDGTIKLVTESVLGTNLPLGIIPGGSANGLAKELGIPVDVSEALKVVTAGKTIKIHLVKINDELCIHLADIGFNAFVIKKFEQDAGRGMWGYIKASWKVLWSQPKMTLELKEGETTITREAVMVVIANASRYGSGALINPHGSMQDNFFEVIIIKKISVSEIYKMMITHMPYDPAKTEVYQTDKISIISKRKAHFQVDGEYMGKINRLSASILPAATQVIVP